MKKLLFLLLIIPFLCSSQIGINTTTPNAMLDVSSTNNGVLVPRVALTSKIDNVTVVNPQGGTLTTSTLIYNTATAGVSPDNVIPGLIIEMLGSKKWIAIGGGKDWFINGNTAIISPAIPVTYGTSTFAATENFIGTTDNNDFTIGTNNIERLRVKNTTGDIGIGTANPTENLHVVDNSDLDKSGILSEVSQTSTTLDYVNTGVRGFGRGTVGWGFGIGVMGMSDPANSYYSSGLYGYLGASTTTPPQPSSNQALFANGNNLGNAGVFMNGNVGIGTIYPSERLHAFQDTDSDKSVILSEARQINTVNDYQNIAIKGYGRGSGASQYGIGIGVLGIGDPTNSYAGTGIHAHLGTTTPAPATSNQALFANGNGLGRAAYFTGGKIVIDDGSQGNGKVLTSDAFGVATWQNTGIDNIVGVLNATGVDIAYNDTANFLQTGSTITLPPGRYAVNVTMLLARNSTPLPSPNNSFFWVRSTFSDSAAINPLSSPDIVGSTLASGNFGGTSVYAMLIGTIIINNTTAANKTYYYVAGRTVFSNTTETLTGIGSTYWAENNIIAYRLN